MEQQMLLLFFNKFVNKLLINMGIVWQKLQFNILTHGFATDFCINWIVRMMSCHFSFHLPIE